VDYLRISVTDRCNLRCTYCMPPAGVTPLPRSRILSYEQIERVARVSLAEGISRIRVTGGEPLVRADVADLVGDLIALAGQDAVALTTNGTLLADNIEALRRAGLARINLSIDSLDSDRYQNITRGGRLQDALAGMDAAIDAGFEPVKVNVLASAWLTDEMDAFVELVANRPVHVRFIERMHIGDVGGPRAPSLTAREVLGLAEKAATRLGLGPPVPLAGTQGPRGWGPARYYRLEGTVGTLGVIAPLTRHFCDSCNRLRLTADGRLRPCLLGHTEVDLHPALAQSHDGALRSAIAEAVATRRHVGGLAADDRMMSQIGG
jgi:cyclic pyranopterin phosphate synthase